MLWRRAALRARQTAVVEVYDVGEIDVFTRGGGRVASIRDRQSDLTLATDNGMRGLA